MRKTVAIGLLSVLFLLPVISASAAPLGLARSEAPFSVDRLEKIIPAVPRIPFTIHPGDKVRTGSGPVMVEGLGGETMLVGGNSLAELVKSHAIRLHDGGLAVSLPQGKDVTLEVLDLHLESVKGDNQREGGIAVAIESADEIRLKTAGRMVRVLSNDGRQIATLGADDIMHFIRDKATGGWNPSAQFEGDPTAVDEGDSKKGGLIGFLRGGGGGGGAAAGGAGAVVAGGAVATGAVAAGTISVTQGNDDKKRDETSPEEPPDEEHEQPNHEEWPHEV